MYLSNVADLELNRRTIPSSVVAAGEPVVSGCVIMVSLDKHCAMAVWECTPGTLRLTPSADVTDVGHVVHGRAVIRIAGRPPLDLSPQSVVRFPNEPYDLEVLQTFRKVSTIVSKEPLALSVEI
jgi:uncharacterized cupin superfamily protein